jgi:pyocin large subunit-like protein
MNRCGLVSCAVAALLTLSGCERSSAVAERDAPSGAAGAEQAFADPAPSRPGPREDHRADPAPMVDGKPLWAASRRYGPQEAADRAFARNGADFGARDVKDFARMARDFVEHPPKGVQTLARTNGDTLFYDPKANVFAVADREGAPRTMFRPREGGAYWEEQKTREASRQAARADRRDRSSDDG